MLSLGAGLYEELFFGPEVTTPTGHPKVLKAKQPPLPLGLSTAVTQLVDAAQRGAPDDHLRALLMHLVPDYQPGLSGNDISDALPDLPRGSSVDRIPLSS